MMSAAISSFAGCLQVLRATGLLLLAALLTTGCSGLTQVLGFKEQAQQAKLTSRIHGQIDTEGLVEGTLVVVLASPGAAPGDPLVGIDTFVRLKAGSFLFSVTAGRYLLGAYEDRNRNGLLDPGERGIRNRTNTLLEVEPGEIVRQDLVIPRGAVLAEIVEPINLFELVARTPKDQRGFSLWALSAQGRVCEELGAKVYGPESGKRGLWRMMDFLNEELAGVHFMQPYDPMRIPVLFVHGVSGYPQEFTSLMAGLDPTRFQPWFYFYPSGFGIDDIASHLATLLERLHVEHGFDELALVTHSMGGLVARGALLKYQEESERNEARLFVSLSAPWGGDERGYAAEAAPIELPESFKDLSPTSDYLHWLFYRDEAATILRRLPDEVDYHLLFSYRMEETGSFSNDGAISVASQLRSEAQTRALSQHGYDLTHSEILRAPEVSQRLNALLKQRFR